MTGMDLPGIALVSDWMWLLALITLRKWFVFNHSEDGAHHCSESDGLFIESIVMGSD